jgi:DNA-binding beta-propeller fold protein YncE
MKNLQLLLVGVVVIAVVGGVYWWTSQSTDDAMLALVTYTAEAGAANSADGVALINLNPDSGEFGTIVQQLDMGAGIVPHHLYYSPDGKQLFITSLGGEQLYTMELGGSTLKGFEAIDTGSCVMGEDIHFSEDGKSFYLTCMGSDEVVKFDRSTFEIQDSIKSDAADAYVRFPHGIGASKQVDRMLITETISPVLDNPGNTVSVVEYSTGNVLSTHTIAKVDGAPSAPVEVMFLPNQPIAYITGMLDASVWAAIWNESKNDFDFVLVDDPAQRGHTWPLEMSVGPQGHLYISYAQPGVVDVYSIQDPTQPKYLRSLPAEAGAHHVLFSEDGNRTFVQNNLLSLDGMNAGTITVVDTNTAEVVATTASFIDANLQPTSMTWLK